VHYANVARALDVRPVTAYEMLRLLEAKGLVRSETVRPQGHKGRSVVVFYPTEKAMALLSELADGAMDGRAWDAAKADILQALEQGKGTDYREMLEEVLLRIPERKTPLLFGADMVTAIILAFYELRDTAAARRIAPHLRRFGPPGWAILYSLAGFNLALSLVEKANRRTTSLLLGYSQQFREYLDNLTGKDKTRLSDFVYEVLQAVGL
jgi:DNA-binding PadR family transcriptional regulator